MQLKLDWLMVLENLRRGIMVTDTTLERLFVNPNDAAALTFFAVLKEWQCSREEP